MNAPLPPCRLTMREIIAITAQHFEVDQKDMLSQRRNDPLVQARHAAAYLIKELLPRSLPEIGRALGNRDHTTIISACRAAEERIASDPIYKAKVDGLRQYLVPARSLASPDADPFEVAFRILNEPRAATNASVETIRNLAAITVAALEEATRQEAEAARELARREASAKEPPAHIRAEIEQLRVALNVANAEIVRLTNRPTPLEAELREFVAAERALETCSGPGERAARQRAEKASLALTLAIETHFNIKRSFK